MHVVWDIPADHDVIAYCTTPFAVETGDRYAHYIHYFCLIEDWYDWFYNFNGGYNMPGSNEITNPIPWTIRADKVDDTIWDEWKQGTYVQLSPRSWYSSWSYWGEEPSSYQ